MRSKKLFQHLTFAMLAIVSISCEKVGISNDSSTFDIDEARTAYEKVSTRALTKSTTEEKSNYFYRSGYEPLWHLAEISENDQIAMVDVPTSSQWTYCLLLNTEKGHQVLFEHHSIAIVKEKASGKETVYNKMRLSTDNHHCSLTHSDEKEDMEDFTGYEFYSNMEGRIIAMNIYDSGSTTLHYFVGTDIEKHNIVIAYLLARVAKYMRFSTPVVTKASHNNDPYTCPVCGNDTFWEVGLSNYICTTCEYVVYADEIDASYCIDVYGGSDGNTPGNLDGDYIDPWIGGSGNGGSNQGGSHSGWTNNGTISYNYSGNSGITISFPQNMEEELREWILNGITTTLEFISNNDVLSEIVNALSGRNINLVFNPNLGPFASTQLSTSTISFKYYIPAVIAEELLHLVQYNDATFRNRDYSYYEFEAKCLLTSVFGAQYLERLVGGTSGIWSYCQMYLDNRSLYNFNQLKNALGYNNYDVSNLVYNSDMTPHLDSWDNPGLTPYVL